MQSVSSRIWTRDAVSISYDDNQYTTDTSLLLVVIVYYFQIWKIKEHHIIISRVISSHMGLMYFETPYKTSYINIFYISIHIETFYMTIYIETPYITNYIKTSYISIHIETFYMIIYIDTLYISIQIFPEFYF